jgi:predicted nuclease with TOPRIM domain
MSDTARDQALAQVASICRMVAALECDFERLEELREERETLAEEVETARASLHGTRGVLKQREGNPSSRPEEVEQARAEEREGASALTWSCQGSLRNRPVMTSG